MDPLLGLLTIAVPVVLLGAGLIALSRWARGRNAEMKRHGNSSSAMDAPKALLERDYPKYAKLLFFGDTTAFERILGRFLAIGVVLLVVMFFVWLGVMLALRG
jgi:hypothetical protein